MTNLCYGLTKCLYIHSTKASESKVETVLWAEKQFRTGHAWRHRRPAPQTLWGVAGALPAQLYSKAVWVNSLTVYRLQNTFLTLATLQIHWWAPTLSMWTGISRQRSPPFVHSFTVNSSGGCDMKVKVAQSRPTLRDPMDYTVHGILQARILEWVATPFSRGSSQLTVQIQVSLIAGGFFTSWATREAGLWHEAKTSANGVHVEFKMQWYFLNPRLYNLWEKGLWCSL